ncbi:hypothetical protein [Desulfotruncus alcoholivorax]|uniref:hypothetical protein n=1 Tax=Desulfotruncus alcoholivorax TaxID=265477 RepID=UPI0004162455|nr:hypothetical protein [Desulfotruncus alcoholivorax]
MDLLVQVDIQTGQVLENNLPAYWDKLSDGRETGRHTAEDGAQFSRPGQPAESDKLHDELLRQRIVAFNSRPRRKTKHAWSEAELYRLALLVGRQKLNYEQASARLARTPRACQFMYRELQKAGVV